MNRIQRFFQNVIGYKQPKQRNLVPFTPIDQGIFTSYDLSIEAQLEQYKGWVYAAVSKIASECASINIKLMQMDDKGDVQEVDKHPALDLLDVVNPFTTKSDLIEITKMYELLTGDAFWWLLKGTNGDIVEIWQYLRPDLISVIPSKENFISHYNYKVPGRGETIRFEVDEIIQFKRPNPFNPYRGISPVKAGEWAIGTDNQAAEYNWRFFGNNARPDYVIKFDDGIDSDQAKLLRTQWENAHQGNKNAHRVAILSKGDVKNIGLSQKDMDFLAQREFSRDEILAMFKVPKALLDPQEINYASAQVAKNIFAEQVIIPEMKRFINTLNEFLLPHFNDDRLFFDFDSPLEDNPDVLLKRYEVLSKVGAISPNEIRQMEGLEPFEGGDDIKPIPDGSISNVKKKIKTIIKPRSRSTTAELIKKIKDELKDSKALDKKKQLVLTKNGDKVKTAREKWADKYFKKQDKEIMKDEKEFATLLAREFQRQKKSVLNSMSKKSIGFAFNVKAESNQFIDIFSLVQKVLVLKYGETALEDLGLSGFDMSNNAKDYLKKNALIFCTSVNETSKTRISNIIQRGEEKGQDIRTVAKEIEKSFDSWSDIKNPGARARSIAHTETARSSNFATVEGWKQSGVVRAKEWYTNPGACPICIPRNGKTISIDKSFNFPNEITDAGFGDVSEPPAHVNCRCLTLPVVIKKSEQMMMYKKEIDALRASISETEQRGQKTISEIQRKADKEVEELRKTRDKLNKTLDEQGD